MIIYDVTHPWSNFYVGTSHGYGYDVVEGHLISIECMFPDSQPTEIWNHESGTIEDALIRLSSSSFDHPGERDVMETLKQTLREQLNDQL